MNGNYNLIYKANRSAAPLVRGGSKAIILAWLTTQADISLYEVYSPEEGYVLATEFVQKDRSETEKLVSQDYRMNPQTEDLLLDGTGLENGMVVLVASAENRRDIKAHESDDQVALASINETNRWCAISNLEVSLGFVSFLATYDDGFKKQRKYPTATAWLYKTDGIKPKAAAKRKIEPLFPTCMPKFYKMNPETEDMLPNGTHLANGMKVLINDSSQRMRVGDGMKDWEIDRALTNNQWCTVSNVKVKYHGYESVVSFIGTYEDGTKRGRTNSTAYTWLVKLDSIGDAMVQSTERYGAVYRLVKRAMHQVDITDANEEAVVEATTKQILGLL